LREDETRSSSQSRQDRAEDSQRLSTSTASRLRSRDQRQSRNNIRSTPDKSSILRPNRPYAAVLAAQLSQRRKQLEARAKEKLKMEKENAVKSPAVDSEGMKVEKRLNSPRVKKTSVRHDVIEIHDDDEQNVTKCQTEGSVDLSNGLPQVSAKTDDTSVKDDSTSTSTADGTPLSTNDASTEQNDNSKCDAGQTLKSQQTSVDSSTTRSTSATVSLINLPMPPVDSESDSEATPGSTEEQL